MASQLPSFFTLAFLLALLRIVAAQNSTLQACNSISQSLTGQVYYPSDAAFQTENNQYWSVALRDITPACIVMPTAASEVASAVQVLNQYPDVYFTVKSGGHDPNPGHSSIDGGVLIAMRYINGTAYDSNTGLATVKPGGDWNDVIGSLLEQGVTVVGGRLGIVGVGGYLLQGGLSFLSAQYGLAADNIVGWEVVNANGSIVNVDAASQPDLAVAMKGSGSQFGIATEFTIQTHPIGQVWGGYRLYPADVRDEIFPAFHRFIPYGRTDPKAAVIITDAAVVGGVAFYLVFYFYDGATPPTTGPFADLLNINAPVDFTSTQSYSSLLSANGLTGQVVGLIHDRAEFRSYALPYVASDPSVYGSIEDAFHNVTSTYLDNLLHATAECSIDFQPLPSVVGAKSQAAGGNALGLTGDDPDRILLEIQCLWASQDDDDTVYALARDLTDWLDTQRPVWEAAATQNTTIQDATPATGTMYMPYLMNDATADQNVTGSYANYTNLKAMQLEFDPNGLFSSRAGGFKY